MTIRIAISPTALKVSAARIAVARASADLKQEIVLIESKYKFTPGTPEQPVDLVEAHVGAFARARDVLGAVDASEATHGLGIENAATYVGRGKWTDPAAIAILGRDGTEIVSISVGIPMPIEELGKALMSRQGKTAGSFIAERIGCDGADWHDHMSSRTRILADGIYAALVQVHS